MEFAISMAVMLMCLLGVLGVYAAYQAKRKQTWALVAQRLGLQWTGSEIQGSLNDVTVRVCIETRSYGNSRQNVTVMRASLDGNVPLGLSLLRENVLRKIGKVVGMQDIQLDLPGLDEKLMVRATSEDEVRRWAQRADVSRGLVDLVAMPVGFEVETHQIKVETSGSLTDGEVLAARLEKLADIARALSGRGYGALIDDGQW